MNNPNEMDRSDRMVVSGTMQSGCETMIGRTNAPFDARQLGTVDGQSASVGDTGVPE